MPFKLTMPKLSPTMEEGVVAKWHKKEGDFVEPGELLLEVSTDKATLEHNAPEEGWLRKVLVKEGEGAAVGEPIALLTAEKEEELPEEPAEKEKEREKKPEKEEEKGGEKASERGQKEPKKPAFSPRPPLEEYRFPFSREPRERVKASPLARKLASERNLDLSSVEGSGPDGRIVSRDLELAQKRGAVSFGAGSPPKLPPGSYREEAMPPIRKAIAERLQAAKSSIPHFYVKMELLADALFEAREQLKQGGLKLSFNDWVIRASALALRQFPEINSGFDASSEKIVRFRTVDISVAVSIEEGLITPIIRHADYKNLGEISSEMKLLSEHAKEGKLRPEEYQGGSFTVSNLGMYGVSEFQAIINPPQAAIVAVGAIREKPVVKGGAVAVGKAMNLTLSADHRIVDGAAAAKFLNKVKEYLENPSLLLIGGC